MMPSGMYYFDGYHSGTHLYNAIIIVDGNERSHETVSINLDVLKKFQFVFHNYRDERLATNVRDWLIKVDDLSIDEKKMLVEQILSFKNV